MLEQTGIRYWVLAMTGRITEPKLLTAAIKKAMGEHWNNNLTCVANVVALVAKCESLENRVKSGSLTKGKSNMPSPIKNNARPKSQAKPKPKKKQVAKKKPAKKGTRTA